MARGRSAEDLATLQMALVGYQVEKQKIEDSMRAIQAQIKGQRVSPASDTQKAPGTKRVLSPAARKRIAAAQRKRWAEHRRRAAQTKVAKEE